MIGLVFGVLCGIALGLTGGGGSILAVPLLVYGIGISFNSAVTISLLVVGLTAFAGFLPKIKSDEVELPAGILLAIAGMAFAPIGSIAGSYINSVYLMLSFSFLMIIIGIWSWYKSKLNTANKLNKNAVCRYLPNGKLSLTMKCKGVLILAGMTTGFLTGMFGVGGGFLIVPALIIAAKMPIKKAITTSLLVIFLVSSSGFISHIGHNSINWHIAFFFVVGGIIGMFAANKIKGLMNDSVLQKVFSVMLIVLGVFMVVKYFY